MKDPNDISIEDIQKIFPISPRDRRENFELFESFIPRESLKDDNAFYTAIAILLNEEGLGSIREYDQRMGSRRKLMKQFGSRSFRFLRNACDMKISDEEIIDLPSDHFPIPSKEATILSFFKRLAGSQHICKTGDNGSGDSFRSDERVLIEEDWRSLLVEISDIAANLPEPDVDAAQSIRSLADELVEKALLAVEQAEGDAAFKALHERLMALEPQLTEQLPKHSVPERLAQLNDTLGEWEDAASELIKKREEFDLLNEEARRGLGNLEEEEKLLKRRFSARKKQDAATKRERVARNTFAGLLPDQPAVEECDQDGVAIDVASDFDHEAISNAEPGKLENTNDLSRKADATTPSTERSDDEMGEEFIPKLTSVENDKSSAEVPTDGLLSSESGATIKDQASNLESNVSDATQPIETEKPTVELVGKEYSSNKQDTVLDPSKKMPTGSAKDPKDLKNTRTLDDLLAHYIENEERAFAWHLSRLSEEQGKFTSIPAAVLESYALSPSVENATDMADPRRNNAMAAMMAALQKAPAKAATQVIALAALLRPALFDADFGTRGHIADLPQDGVLSPYAPLIEMLSTLGHQVRPSAQDLAELVGAKHEARLPASVRALQFWLEEIRQRKTHHQPTNHLLHKELEADGYLGRPIEAAIAGHPEAAKLVSELIIDLKGNRSRQEKWIAECETGIGRPRRNKIEGTALDWFCQKIEETCSALAEWVTAHEGDKKNGKERNLEELRISIGALSKTLNSVLLSDAASGTPLDRAAQATLQHALRDFGEALEGRKAPNLPIKSLDVLERSLLRLPGGCQYVSDNNPEFSDEKAFQENKLFDALQAPEHISLDLRSAFKARLDGAAILAGSKILELLEKHTGEPTTLSHMRQDLEEFRMVASKNAIDQVEQMRRSFTTLLFLDLDTSDEVRSSLVKLSAISEALKAGSEGSGSDQVMIPALNGIRQAFIPSDFPDLKDFLEKMEMSRNRLRHLILERQCDALEAFTQGAVGQSARAILDRITDLDPIMLDDAIADLRAGRAVTLPEGVPPDVFAVFFPDFVAQIDNLKPGRGQVIQAIEEGGNINPLNFEKLEQTERSRSKRILETWGAAENSMKKTDKNSLRRYLENLLGQIGFTGTELTYRREMIPGRMRLMSLQTDIPQADGWFLPASFGSETNGFYNILITGNDVPIKQSITQVGSHSPDGPWIVVTFGRMLEKDRRDSAKLLRREGRQVLFVDETVILFLAGQRGDLMEAFFSCLLPFTWVQPYNTNPGSIPPEVFVGRRDEIEKITARSSSGCLIYGGRQLGKSALLNHISRQRHRPEQEEIAIALDIKPIGGPAIDAKNIWAELIHSLQDVKNLTLIDEDEQGIVTELAKWINAKPNRRILAMFDEADNFLAAEHSAGYQNLLRLKRLMEDTNWRFKVVFAGLHNVRRMSRAPNSPLPHLGEPICIGPMNQNSENRAELRRLAIEPMRAAGLDYEEPMLVQDMLSRMNYYPSLVQVFGHQIVENVGRRQTPTTKGPRWKLSRSTLFEGEIAERIASEIRKRFQWTLNLDLRYELIAKSIALHRLETIGGDGAVLSRGLSLDEISKLVIWPSELQRPGKYDLEELLKEMVDLGVLADFPNSRYGLRNAQVAQMLGQRDLLQEEILALSEREEDPPYDASTYFRSLRPKMPGTRSPVNDRMIGQLTENDEPGLRVLLAPECVVGGKVSKRMEVALDRLDDEGKVRRTKGTRGSLRKLVDSVKSSPLFIVIEGQWNSQVAEWLIAHEKTKSGMISPIWCLEREPQDIDARARLFRAGVWSEVMLRHWLRDEGLSPALDDRETRRLLMMASGGIPARLEVMRPDLDRLVSTRASDRKAPLVTWMLDNPLNPIDLDLEQNLVEVLSALREFGVAINSLTDLTSVLEIASQNHLDLLMLKGLIASNDWEEGPVKLTPLGHLVTS
jgi:hypothetical protein